MRRKVSGNGCKMIDQLVTEADPFWLKYRNWYWARTMLSPGSVIPGRNECPVKQLVATIWMDRVHKTHFTEEQNSLLLLNAIRVGFNISYWWAIQISAQKLANELEMSLMQSRDALSQLKTRISFGMFFWLLGKIECHILWLYYFDQARSSIRIFGGFGGIVMNNHRLERWWHKRKYWRSSCAKTVGTRPWLVINDYTMRQYFTFWWVHKAG